MSRVTRIGKVRSYDPRTGRVVCHVDPSLYFWIGGIVRTSGTHPSICITTMRTFDVTVSAATAAQLQPDFLLSIEYDDRPGPVERVTRFAGESIGGGAVAGIPPAPPA